MQLLHITAPAILQKDSVTMFTDVLSPMSKTAYERT